MPRLDRLTSILIQLQSKRIVAAKEIADRFDISIRTVYRDIRTLEQAGVPLMSEPGIGYSLMKEYRLPPVHFTSDEALAFITAGKLVKGIADAPTVKHYEAALFKIKAVLDHHQKEYVNDLTDKIAFVKNQNLPSNEQKNLQIADILHAITHKKVITFGYRTLRNSQLQSRNAEAVGVYSQGHYWYLIAWCQMRQAYRNFRLDRMEGLQVSNEHFFEKHPNLDEYLASTKEEKELQKIVILIDKDAYPYLGDQKYYMGIIEELELAQHYRLTFLHTSLNSFAHWMLYLAAYCTIVEPLSLKDLILQKTKEISERLLT